MTFSCVSLVKIQKFIFHRTCTDYILPTFSVLTSLAWLTWRLKRNSIHVCSSIYSYISFFVEDRRFCFDLISSTVWLNRVWHDNRLCSLVKIKNASNFFIYALQDFLFAELYQACTYHLIGLTPLAWHDTWLAWHPCGWVFNLCLWIEDLSTV